MQAAPPNPNAPRSVSPSPPIATPFFYGWVIVACVAAAAFLSSGTTNVVISVLLKPMTEETGWSRTMISSALGVGAVASGLLSPFAGSLADRFGGRVLISVSGVLYGLLYSPTAPWRGPRWRASQARRRSAVGSSPGGRGRWEPSA
ncbi:MAG: MFS transporter [Chloroflexi bacterium]|nr:MFS transporter [Chloroflexota bacterium]